MATLVVYSSPAEPGPGGTVSYLPARDVLPPEHWPIRSARDASAAFESFAARVKATGQIAHVAARLSEGRAPAGFRALRLRQFVNLPA